MNDVFAIVPVEAVRDRRLTLETLRVLIALLSFRAKNTDCVWPKRAQLAERCNMHPSNISAATSRLVELGWLEKTGHGGCSKSSVYRVVVPDFEVVENVKTVAQSATVARSATVAQSATQTVAQSATQTVAQSATRIYQTNEQTIEQTIPVVKHTPDINHLGQNETANVCELAGVEICALWLSLGMVAVNPSHPVLIEIVNSGATRVDCEFAGKQAVERGKGFSYALGIVRGLLADRRRQEGDGHGAISGGQRGKFEKSGGKSRVEHSRRIGEHLDRLIEAEFGTGVGIGAV